MGIKLILNIFLLTIFTSCQSQMFLSKAVIATKSYPHLKDSTGKTYEPGVFNGGLELKVLFKEFVFDKKSCVLEISGLTTVFHDKKDTIGICCIQYFIAQPVNGILTNVRYLGISSERAEGSIELEGHFSFKMTISEKDRLYFTSETGEGTEEYLLNVLFGTDYTRKASN